MTAVTTVMGIRCCTYQCIIMTILTEYNIYLYQAGMVWSGYMKSTPVTCMTGLAVTASCKGFGISTISSYKGTVNIMTGGTCIMRPRCSTYQSIIMTVEAGRRSNYSYQRAMVNRCRVGRNKSTMTGGAVAANAKGLPDCKAS